MKLSLLLIEVGFDLARGIFPAVIPTSLTVAPEPRMIDALLALPRTNERNDRDAEPSQRESGEPPEDQPQTPGDEPAFTIAVFRGSNDRAGGTTMWDLSVRQLKAVRAAALADEAWWAQTGPHNRAVLAYINELSDSTRVHVMQTGQASKPSN